MSMVGSVLAGNNYCKNTAHSFQFSCKKLGIFKKSFSLHHIAIGHCCRKVFPTVFYILHNEKLLLNNLKLGH